MSFFPFGGGGGGSSQEINQQNVAMVEQEYEAVTEAFYRIVDSCFKKCIPPKYIESELNKGESVCIDRCFSKYIDVTTKIGEALAKKGQDAGARTGGFGV